MRNQERKTKSGSSRVLKFRAWDLFNKEMDYGMKFTAEDRSLNDVVKDFGTSLMQYTGLKDKNGKEIYEGDVVKIYDPERCGHLNENEEEEPDGVCQECYVETCEVKWGKEGGYWSTYSPLDYNEPLGNDMLVLEVIGNIYETPNLLTP